MPGLRKQEKGKFVILTLNGDVGKAISESSANSMLVHGIILAKAANIIRKHLFSKTEVFDGDLSMIKRQRSSVTLHLLHLLGLILEGITEESTINDATESI